MRQFRDVSALLQQDLGRLAGTKPEHILTFSVAMTDKCNLRCVYCHQSLPEFKGWRDLEGPNLAAAFEYGARHKLGLVDLTGGGDLLQHPRWREVCEQAIAGGLKVTCTLNLSTILSDEDAATLARFDSIMVSLDTLDRQTLSAVRKAVDVRTIMFNMHAIKAAAPKGRGPKWGVSVVLYPESARGLPRLVSFLEDFGVTTLRIQDLVSLEKLANNVPNLLAMQGDDAVSCAREMVAGLDAARRAGIDVQINYDTEQTIRRMAEGAVAAPVETRVVGLAGADGTLRRVAAAGLPQGMTRACTDPWTRLMLKPTGDLQVCCGSPMLHGSIGEGRTFDDVRNGERARKLRTDLLNGTLNEYCAGCTMRPVVSIADQRRAVRRFMLEREHPALARLLELAEPLRHHLINRPYLFWLTRGRHAVNVTYLGAMVGTRKAKHYGIDVPRLVWMRHGRHGVNLVLLGATLARRKTKHYLFDLPHLYYLRKIKPRWG